MRVFNSCAEKYILFYLQNFISIQQKIKTYVRAEKNKQTITQTECLA